MPEAKELGTSDSKIFLQKIVDVKESDPAMEIGEIVTSLARESEYNSMSALLMSPDEMWIWRIYDDKDPENIEVYEAYYTLYLSLRNGYAIVSSEPLDEGNWQLLPNKTFLNIRPSDDSLQLSYRMLNI